MSKNKFNIFNFKFGRHKKDLKDIIKVGAILHGFLDLVSLIPGVQKKNVFNFIDIMQQKLGIIDIINDYVIQDPELLSYRIYRIVSKSISEYEKDNV